MPGWSTATECQLQEWIRTACLLECAAPKPGNVHPGAAFDDLEYAHFVESAIAAAPPLSRSRSCGVGVSIEAAARATWDRVERNTNLGILLLLAPLAAATGREDVEHVLADLTVDDARCAYRAIAALQPGGMGEVADQDVAAPPEKTLRECMALAADRDSIARQYTNGFADVWPAVDRLDASAFSQDWQTEVVRVHLQLMVDLPDTLIARKCGHSVAAEAARRARKTLDRLAGGPQVAAEALADLDNWLRGDGHRRNPGTTADLVTAVVFVSLREGRISCPPEVGQNGAQS